MSKYQDDERVLSAFLYNFRMSDIIRETGLSKTTAYKIRNDPEFQKALQARKDGILRAAVEKMRGYLVRDVDILQQIIDNPKTSPQTRINAIQILFGQFRDFATTTDIVNRITELEEFAERERK